MVDAAGGATDLPLGRRDCGNEVLRLADVGRRKRQVGDERFPHRPLRLSHPSLRDRVVSALPELLIREHAGRARDADHPVVLRHQAGAVEVEEARQELALCEVARRSEEDDHVVFGPPADVAVHAATAWTVSASARYAAPGRPCQKTALPATSRSAPAPVTAAAFSRETPPST